MEKVRGLRGTRPGVSSSHEESVAERYCKFYPKYAGRLAIRSDQSPPMQASGRRHAERSGTFVLRPPADYNVSAERRAEYFSRLQKDVEVESQEQQSSIRQASTFLDLMIIRSFNCEELRRCRSLGTALGFRTRQGVLTHLPAIIVFVARKINKQWLLDVQALPPVVKGPGGIWCDVDVVEFSYSGASAVSSSEEIYSELVDGLCGNDPCIGSGSQVASLETYGTLGAIVRSQVGSREVGFLTNRQVAVDLDCPHQNIFHPVPPNLGPGVYLGAVERATSFISDKWWYGVFAGMNPESFVWADGAFIPFSEEFDTSRLTTSVRSVGEIGEVLRVDLRSPIDKLVGQHVVKVGTSSGLTNGTIMGYSVEYNDERGMSFFSDFLIVGEGKQAFDLEGDSGSLILVTGEEIKPRPVGIIWGGTGYRGSLKLRSGRGPENWTSGIDLGRLLDLLLIDIITTPNGLTEALAEQMSPNSGGSCPENVTGSCEVGERDKVLKDIEFPQLKANSFSELTGLKQRVDSKEEMKLDTCFSLAVKQQCLEAPGTTQMEDLEIGCHREDIALGLPLSSGEGKRKRSSP